MMNYYTGKKMAVAADLISTTKRIRKALGRDVEEGSNRIINGSEVRMTNREIHRSSHARPVNYSENGVRRGG